MRWARTRGPSLQQRLAALERALGQAAGRVPDEMLADARAAVERAEQRRARGDGAVVVALCGGTGTGKSTLFNTLAGDELAAVDVRRPTTSAPTALAVGPPQELDPLLDWLDVPPPRRHNASAGHAPDGLVLVDLPDIDSIEDVHHVTAARLIERVDVLIWVVDPLKYAQRSLHEGYLAQLQEHAEVMWVVLNQIDRLDAGQRRACQNDLEGLVGGRRGVQVLPVSATTGEGIDELRDVVSGEVEQRRAIAARIAADVRTAALGLQAALDGDPSTAAHSSHPKEPAPLDQQELTSRLAALAGLEQLADYAEVAYRQRATQQLRTPLLAVLALVGKLLSGVTRWIGRLVGGQRTLTKHPAPTPVASGLDVRHALLEMTSQLRQTLPWYWAAQVKAAVDGAGRDLPATLKAALSAIPLEPQQRRWWRVYAVCWTVIELVAAFGLVWLLLYRLAGFLMLPRPPLATIGDDISLPGLLLASGLLLWLLLLLVRRLTVGMAARRHRKLIEQRAKQATRDTIDDTAVSPLRDELETYQHTRDALAVAAGN